MAKTGLWWDISSCEFPSYFPPSLALHVAPSLLHNFALHNSNGCVTTNAYSYKQNKELQNTLNKAGFKLQIIPSGSEKEKIEKIMVGDVTLWTTKNPPPANIIMLGSSNVKNALRELHYKGYKILLCNSNFNEIYKHMLSVCHKHISWSHFLSSLLNEYEILRGLVQNGNCKIPLSSFADSSYSFMESKICSRDHVRPGFSSKNKYSNKTLGLEEFKAWLVETVGSEKYRIEGYDISGIPRDFLNSTGMRLQLNLLGCSRIIELVQLCNDVVTLVRLRHSYLVVFPRGGEHGYNAVFPRPQEHANSVVPSPQGYLNLQGGFKATMLQFHGFICRMMLLGDFSKGLLLCALAKKFEERSGLLLDFKDLDYARLSDLVATCSVVAIQSDGPGQSLVSLSAEGKMYIKQIGKNGKDTKPIALKTDPANVVSVNSDSKRKHLFVEYTQKESNSVKLPRTEANEGKINVPMNIFPSECFGRQPGNVVKNVATSKVSSAKSTVQKSGNAVKDVAASLVTSSESSAYQSGNFAVGNIIVNATSAGLPTKDKFCASATSSSGEQISLKTNTGNQKSTLKTNTRNQKPITLKTNTANLASVNSDTKGKPYFVEYTEGGSGYVKLPCTEGKMPVSFNISPSECIIRQPGNLVKDAATSKVSSAKSTAQKSGNVIKDVAASLVTSAESIAHQSGNFAGENTIVNATSAGLPTKEKSCIPATSSPREQISCFPSECPYPNRMDNNNPYVRHVNDDVKIDVKTDNGEEETDEKLQGGKSEKDKGNAGWGKCCLNFAIRCLKGIAGWGKCCLNFAIQCLKRLFRSLLNCVVLYKKIIGKGKD